MWSHGHLAPQCGKLVVKVAETLHDPSSLAGHLLCAVPQLIDPNFRRSVVFMLDHGDDGAFGLVLNNPLPNLMSEVCASLKLAWHGEPDETARLGGPVEPIRGWILHDQPDWDPHGRAVLPGVFLTTSLAPLQRAGEGALGGDGCRLMFLLGYAGWGPGQVEREIAAGSWVAVPVVDAGELRRGVRPGWMFDAEPTNMWSEALGAIGVDPSRLVGLSGATGLH